MRLPIRKANSVRMVSTLIFYQMMGFILTTLSCTVLVLFFTLMGIEWPLKLSLRVFFANLCIAQLVEMTYVRTCITPLFQTFECGPALFVINLWYMSIGLLKALTRLGMLTFFVVQSNFNPQHCIFPDGMESWDSAHVCFLCYVMERVRMDEMDNRAVSRLKVALAFMGKRGRLQQWLSLSKVCASRSLKPAVLRGRAARSSTAMWEPVSHLGEASSAYTGEETCRRARIEPQSHRGGLAASAVNGTTAPIDQNPRIGTGEARPSERHLDPLAVWVV